MKRLLYISNIDWNWIKQRPQFLAEHLSNFFDVLYIYQYGYNRKGYQNNQTSIIMHSYYVLPVIDKLPFLFYINVLLKKIYFRIYILFFKPNVIMLTNPFQIMSLPISDKYSIAYDCMDDYYGLFEGHYSLKNVLLKCESKICQVSSNIFASSNYLSNKLCERYINIDKSKISIVANAFNGDIINTDINSRSLQYNNNEEFEITYFGTISNWFDFDLVLKSLKDFDCISYKLYGPIRNIKKFPDHDRIKYCGTIEHKNLYDATRGTNCFILPFILSEAILSVDPVKLYEYINFNKNILCIKYDEVLKFDKFVYFYTSYEEYKEKLDKKKTQLLRPITVKLVY